MRAADLTAIQRALISDPRLASLPPMASMVWMRIYAALLKLDQTRPDGASRLNA